MAEEKGSDSDSVEVPEQGNLFGDLWSLDPECAGVTTKSNSEDRTVDWSTRPETRENGCGPEPIESETEDYHYLHAPMATSADLVDKARYLYEDGSPLTAIDAVNQYIEKRYGENTSKNRHGFNKGLQYYAKNQYNRGMGMDRQWLDQHDNPSTVLLSLRASPTSDGRLSLLNELGDALDEAIAQIRYRLQLAPNSPFDSDEWGYFAVFAGTRKRATPHAHIMVYCAGDVEREWFVPAVEKFVANCRYSPETMRGNDPAEGTISIRGNGTDSIPKVDDSHRHHKDCEFEGSNSQGAVYALTQLPHLENVDNMAKDELLHSSTVDAWSGKPFRCSKSAIEESYLATSSG
ncbi:hypothetical protein [Halapricum hydrolyticum]|uniref:Replication protein n=1 Tax=Halapricum hydrolyticum TaxID=2979991 RepID=A0AAE3LGG2_9EURY|nr:hypothetical protein [Halapricum hydrolyticum]MCU4719717.1 hypothetical protein [Halapricum hydrolyticum]MCU4728642.1 hypothetical protein [Halapricum hydrolyticum]